MKKTMLIFLLWIFFVVLTILKIYVFRKLTLFLMFVFWVFISYREIHIENKKARTPRPVYLANPEY